MDWNAAIERNREALKRILATLVAMAGRASLTSPLRGGRWSPDHRVGVIVGTQPPPDASRRPPLKGEVEAEFPPTLPRHLHRAVLALLRPAEAAARRLVIVAARGLGGRTQQAREGEIVAPPRPHKAKPRPPSIFVRNGVGTGIVMPPHLMPQASLSRTAPRTLALPLFDPLPRWPGRGRPAASGVPRISVPGYSVPFPVAAPPSPYDPIDARRLFLRLQALGRVLDDLPREAKRFARWQASRAQIKEHRDAAGAQSRDRDAAGAQSRDHDAAGAQSRDRDAAGAQSKKTTGPFCRVWPLRPGRPPGWCRRPDHEVHEILNVVHGLAIWALEDTS